MMNNNPTKAQQHWMELGYGMFLHFGPNTLVGKGWGDGTFPAAQVNFPRLDCRQWAGIAAEAGMKYAVLTAKHHDGFCLWPSAHTDYCIKNTPQRRDIVGEYIEAFRSAGIETGLYYSLWDCNCPFYEDDTAYAEYMQAQIRELLTGYGDIVELWFDGGWDKVFPTRKWDYNPETDGAVDPELLRGARWRWRELYALIHQLQPHCLVANNSSSALPGVARYQPIDLRTAEHFDFVFREQVCKPDTRTQWTRDDGESVFLPLEFCTSLNPDWFHTGRNHFVHPSAHTIAGWRQTAREHNANLLLNVGPNRDGLIPQYHRDYLIAARQLKDE
jgi:alpha-L-fucosidase